MLYCLHNHSAAAALSPKAPKPITEPTFLMNSSIRRKHPNQNTVLPLNTAPHYEPE